MTNKKFKLAAMSLATAVAVSAVGPSASAVTYYLGDGSVTVDKDDTRGAYSYQGEDGSEEHRTYVNEDEADHGTIYVKGGNAPTGDVTPPTDNSGNGTEETTTGNTITVKEDVKEGTTSTDHTTDSSADNTENNTPTETAPGNTITVKEDVKDATIVVDGVNVDTSDTSTPTDTLLRFLRVLSVETSVNFSKCDRFPENHGLLVLVKIVLVKAELCALLRHRLYSAL